MKNKRKILITLALCALIIIYGSYFIKNQKKLAIEQFRTSEKQLIKEIKQEASENPSHSLVESTQDDSDMFLMVPTDSQATMIKDVQEDMAKLADSLIKKQR